MKILAIVRTNIVRTLRDRTALFFSVLLPLILILVLGMTFGGNGTARVGVVDADGSTTSEDFISDIAATHDMRIEVVRYGSIDALRDAAERGYVQVGLAVPTGYEQTILAGGDPSVSLIAPPTTASGAVATAVQRAIGIQSATVRAMRFRQSVTGADALTALRLAQTMARQPAPVATTVEHEGAASSSASSFQTGAQSQLILFMFLTALTGATELVVTRQLGISRRMLATPTSVRTIIVGESLARIALALLQGLFIVAATSVLFGVAWGNPLATGAIVLVFAVVAGSAAMLIGTIVANPSQAGALAPAMGMLFGLLGGTMVPAEVFPATMQTLSRATPHAWAMDAFRVIGGPGATIASIAPQLAVLSGFAVALMALAILRFRRVLSR